METRDENLAEWCNSIMCHCLFREEELKGLEKGVLPEGALCIDGIVNKFALHPGRVEEKKEEIKEILDRMPTVFHVRHGGGMSFLKLCIDKDDNHWAEHITMEALVVLGIATKMASFPLPKELWQVFPGGMPYVTFDTRSDAEKVTTGPKEEVDEQIS